MVDRAATLLGMTAAPGWYPDPTQPATLRFWTGATWTEQRAPLPPPAPQDVAKDPNGLIISGMILAILIPIVGFVIGIVALTKPRGVSGGILVMVVAVIAMVFWWGVYFPDPEPYVYSPYLSTY